jgi:hypothetical protein
MTADRLLQAGRLSLREEGELWIAYYALPHTMKDDLVLGSIHMGAVFRSEERKQQFMSLMKEVVADLIEDATGKRPIWPDPPRPAPEHERSGHG